MCQELYPLWIVVQRTDGSYIHFFGQKTFETIGLLHGDP